MSRMGWERAEDLQEQDRYEGEADLRGRLFFLRLLVVVIFGGLLTYIIILQQQEGENFTATALDNQFAELRSDAPRGVIFDRVGRPLAENLPSFDVTITPAFLPADEADRQAVFERLSLLTGVPITNTLAQQTLVQDADPEELSVNRRLAELYGEVLTDTLNDAGIVDELPESIAGIVETFSFAQYIPTVITSNVGITLARVIQQESVFMPGVQVLPSPLRNYPSGEITAHLVGFMGPIPDRELYVNELGYNLDDRVGLFGLESSMEGLLSGDKGSRTIEVDSTGREVRQIGLESDPTAGYNLHLSLDLALQETAHQILADQLELRRNTPDPFNGNQLPEVELGVVVALDPKTGEILAMVNIPSFDNNRFATEIPVDYYLSLARNDYQPLLNNAIAGQYPPGSVFKIVTGAAAMQEGIVSPGRQLVTPGSIVIPNQFAPNDPGRSQRFVCWIWNTFDAEGNRGEHGAMDMYRAMAESCDIYFYKVAGGFDQDGERVDALTISRLAAYAEQFGFGRIQGIELPAEAPGIMPTEQYKRVTFGEPWSTGDDYNTSIGQGALLATPMQIAQMAAVIANGGFLYRPTVIHHLTDDQGRVVLFEPDDIEETNPIFATPGENGIPILQDSSGNFLDASEVDISVQFDENGEFVRQPELLNVVEVDQQYIEVVADGMFQANQPGGTAGFIGQQFVNDDNEVEVIPWLEQYDIVTAGKTGTAEFCDALAFSRGWCAQTPDQIQPTHSWYVGYAPFDDPEIVVVGFIYNGGEGSEWAGPVVERVMEAYFGVGDYALDELTNR